MIKARTRRIIQGSDYSAQEPRLLSQLCGDENMLQAYHDGKDLYVEIAAIALKLTYKECLEHFPKGCPIKKDEYSGKWEYALLKTGKKDDICEFEDFHKYTDPDFDPDLYDYEKLADGETDTFKVGKDRRGQAKRILLGIMYGRGERSIAEQLGCEVEEARDIKNNVYTAFPKIKQFEDDSNAMVKNHGYVTTLWGRKRRLLNYNLPKYDFFYIDRTKSTPGKKVIREDMQVPDDYKAVLENKINNTYFKKRNDFYKELEDKEDIMVVDNSSKIAAAQRQIINSRVQGSAADMSKLSLIRIYNDEELKNRGVKLIIPVHDEILIETPLRYAKYVKERFEYDMNNAAKPKLTIPTACDVVSSERWYGEELNLDEILDGLDD